MTDISFKNRIIALVSFSLAALILALRNVSTFSLIFFAFFGIVLFFADRILNEEKIKERTVLAFFIFAVCYQTFFQIFYRTHETNRMLMAASALAIFLASVFALTDIKKLPYAIFSAPLICLLDIKIATAYCVLLLSFTSVKLMLELNAKKSGKKTKTAKKNKNKENSEIKIKPMTLISVSMVTCVVCTAFCIYSFFKNKTYATESLNYFFTQFKNTVGFVLFIVYFLVKLVKSKLRINAAIILGLALNIAAAVLFTYYSGWEYFSLFIVSSTIFLGLVCLESEKIISEIKADYQNHKYLFFIGLLCMLQ